MMPEYFFLILTIALTVTAQIILKKGTSLVKTSSGLKEFTKSLMSKHIIIAVTLVLIASLSYLIALSKIELGKAFAFTGLNYPLVTIGSGIFLKEKINKYHIIGILFILWGFIIFGK